ncbi:hypothetical protein GUJ93_ZPchr0010g8949 [Zizania palustris]|uniref:Uncharacterized protein n=1 Tax=Zizania palustris TaxID=103762 RepID=A0A8J5WBY4_ZIZPA|nr:hypothetical protein GUJ93_ZPchr0010g8949 [Zizania palustris]
MPVAVVSRRRRLVCSAATAWGAGGGEVDADGAVKVPPDCGDDSGGWAGVTRREKLRAATVWDARAGGGELAGCNSRGGLRRRAASEQGGRR